LIVIFFEVVATGKFYLVAIKEKVTTATRNRKKHKIREK